ncbi:hypothetical protein GCM10007086_14280 [Photobacterium aphoticum]|nr:hypothetical protein GCM10007086_14280 [Photobacterium aphoticum]
MNDSDASAYLAASLFIAAWTMAAWVSVRAKLKRNTRAYRTAFTIADLLFESLAEAFTGADTAWNNAR